MLENYDGSSHKVRKLWRKSEEHKDEIDKLDKFRIGYKAVNKVNTIYEFTFLENHEIKFENPYTWVYRFELDLVNFPKHLIPNIKPYHYFSLPGDYDSYEKADDIHQGVIRRKYFDYYIQRIETNHYRLKGILIIPGIDVGCSHNNEEITRDSLTAQLFVTLKLVINNRGMYYKTQTRSM